MTDNLQGSMIALHGPPKVGKTQLASHFPGPVQFLAVEVGHKFITDDQKKILIPIPPETGWNRFEQFVEGREVDKSKPKTLVIDTISGLYNLCFEAVCKKNHWNHPSDDGHGKGWAAVRRQFATVLSKLSFQLSKYNTTLILIDHTKEELIETTTANIKRVAFAMTGQARDIVLRIPDHMWFLGYAEEDPSDARKVISEKRALFVRGNSAVEAGCRDPLAQASVIMPLSKKDPYRQILTKLYGEKKE